MYRILLRNNPKKFLHKLTSPEYLRFSEAFRKLSQDPLSGDIKKLRGDVPNAYRLRIGDRRVLFIRNDDNRTLDIVVIEKRGDIY